MSELNNKVAKATKWSVITEIVSKLVTPVTSMVLARLLTPEAFGVVTTLTMIISFAELFTDAGFQKYLVQHEFRDVTDREQSTTVAFWSNFIMSLFLWGIIIVFAEPLAALVGNPGLGIVLIVACVAIPIAAFSSIQMALYRRDLDFKTLFKVRIVSIIVPLVVTVPLAFWLRSYWALVFGSITKGMISAILLTYYSSWKPRLYYSFEKLKEMLSFSVWSLIEAISLWLTSYVDVFIVGTILSQYYLGLYKTSSTTVNHIIGLITAATTPVLFSSLSRLQSDEDEFRQMFFKFQKLVGMLVIPMGVGIFCFSDLVTAILLGDQWTETSGFIGLWGLTSSITVIFGHYSSEVYRAKGRPKLSVLSQWLHIIALWPTVLIAVHYGFETLYTARSLVRLEGVAVNMIIMYYVVRISPWDMVKNTSPSLLASMVMMCVAYLLLSIGSGIIWQICSVFVCMPVYFGIIFSQKNERTLLLGQIRNKR